MSPEVLWNKVHSAFELSDDSLPEIAVVDLEPDEVVLLYARILSNGRLVDAQATFWDYETNSEGRISDVPNAAERVVTGKAAGFTFTLIDIVSQEVTLPEIGFQVFESTIIVFYQTGRHWDATRTYAFFSWLRDLVLRTRAGRLDLSQGPADVFPQAWAEFISPNEQ